MRVELVPKMKRSHPRFSRHAEGLVCMEWNDSVARRLSALRSLSISLILSSLLSSLHISLLGCPFACILPMLFSLPPPAFSSISLPTLPHAVAVGWSGFLGCGCCGDIWKICGLLAGDRGGRGAGRIGRKSSELSAHQILVGGKLG